MLIPLTQTVPRLRARPTRMISKQLDSVIASGGAGTPSHLYEVLEEGKADAALVASMVHYGEYSVSGIKRYLDDRGLKIACPGDWVAGEIDEGGMKAIVVDKIGWLGKRLKSSLVARRSKIEVAATAVNRLT